MPAAQAADAPPSDTTPPKGQIHPFSEMTVTFEPLIGLSCPSGFKKFVITMT